jgi:hypothetical protein
MRTLTPLVIAALVLSAGNVRAEDARRDAKHVGKTAAHGTTGVGKSGSKIYHDVAGKVHKLIAKNAKNDQTRAKHMTKSQIHRGHATRKTAQSEREMKKAERNSDQVGK